MSVNFAESTSYFSCIHKSQMLAPVITAQLLRRVTLYIKPLCDTFPQSVTQVESAHCVFPYPFFSHHSSAFVRASCACSSKE